MPNSQEIAEQLEATLRVVRGAPTAELAAAIAVIEAARAEEIELGKGFERRLSSTWSSNQAQLRSPITPGPGAWRAAYRSGLN
jgi:methylthioribose-1-phosphate isomerase